jgi:hypothetical protein
LNFEEVQYDSDQHVTAANNFAGGSIKIDSDVAIVNEHKSFEKEIK